MAPPPPPPPPAAAQLVLPLGPPPPSPPSAAPPLLLAPAQLWPSLAPPQRAQLRQALIQLLQEVVADAQH